MKASIFDDIRPNSFMQEFTEPEQGFDMDQVKGLTEEQLYHLIPECPLCGCLQGAENIKICKDHQEFLFNKLINN